MGEAPARTLRLLYTNPYTNRGMRRPSSSFLIPRTSAGVVPTFTVGARQGHCISCHRGGRRAVRAEDARAGDQLHEQQAEARRLATTIEANPESLGYAISE
jgi:hypothetical protein